MSRIARNEPIVVRPANDIYTALVIVALLVEIVGLVVLYLNHTKLFGTGLFS